jgi:tight adherence protein B
MSPDLLMIVVGVLGFVAIAGLGFAFAGGDSAQAKTAKRVQAVAGTAKGDRVRKIASADTAGARRKQVLDNLKAAERQQRREKLSLGARIQQAGLSFGVRQFWIGSAVLGVLVAVLGLALRLAPIYALGLGFAAGLGLPRWMLSFLCNRRYKKFTEEFPGAIDIVVRGIKSGLPVNDCLKIIAKETPQPLAGEFTKVVESISVGSTITEALEKMHTRMPTPEVRFLSIVMAIQSKTGGNLAEALNNLSVVLRARKLMREKVKAMSGEAIASAFIIGSLPPGIMLLVSISSPGYMAPMFADPRGHMMLMGGALWMACGIFVMRKMINFKI